MKITLATLAQASAKEVLDQVSTHLLRQGERAVNESGGCVYRTKEGLSCAAGCLMTEDEAALTPNNGWGYLCDMGLVTHVHCDLIVDLQSIHDDYLPEFWADRLQVMRNNVAEGMYEE